MGVRYDKLFHMMIDRRLTTSQLMKMCGFSANIITRLKKNEYISMESLGKLCKVLGQHRIMQKSRKCDTIKR